MSQQEEEPQIIEEKVEDKLEPEIVLEESSKYEVTPQISNKETPQPSMEMLMISR